ncbi:MAG: ATP-binding protein [Firmicutes bacterium]|nr:ATP-binding protein [Bacillota bacterium]
MLREEVNGLLFFRAKSGSILSDIIDAEERSFRDTAPEATVLSVMNRLVSLSASMGIEGNLWQNYLIHFALTDENAYTLSRERSEAREDSFSALALGDYAILQKLMDYDFSEFRRLINPVIIDNILDFHNSKPASEYSGAAGEMITAMREKLIASKSTAEFKAIFDAHYESRGTGDFAYCDAFRLVSAEGGNKLKFKPIRATEKVSFADMIAYESQIGELKRNTEAFVEGRPANNVLLYGDSGSGKSTSVKALINEYSSRGLRIIEIHKHQFKCISEVLKRVKTRNYRFILYIDDLSFEEFEIEYKYLKAVIEGDLEIKPENVLIYATSNRRHLIKETFADRKDMEHIGEIHRSDTIEEKTSLSTRFGVQIYYPSPARQEYHAIVRDLASKAGVEMDEAELFVKADAWEIRHGGVSCRTARQFVDYLASGKEE